MNISTASIDDTIDKSFDTMNILLGQLALMWESTVKMLPGLIAALFVLLITWILSRYAVKIAGLLTRRSKLRPSLRSLIDTLTRITIWVMGVLIALTILLPGLTATSLIAGLGVGTVAIGFAFQDIFENFLAGIFIMARQKMRLGDYIECQGIRGTVEVIKLRETHIRELSRELSIVPNAQLFKNSMRIITDESHRRHEIVTGVAYDTDLEVAREVIRKAVAKADGIDPKRGIDVLATEFNSSSIDFTVRWWSGSSIPDMLDSRDSVIRRIKIALNDAGIEIPFPYVTHTFKSPVHLRHDNANIDDSE